MARVDAIVVLMMAAALLCEGQEAPQTQLRHGQTLVIPARAGEEIKGTMFAISASLGYPDPLGYRLLDPLGRRVTDGVIPAGRQAPLQFRAARDGAYLLSLDPQNNACALERVKYALDLGEERFLQLYKTARPVYFRVPEGVKRFVLSCEGEAATMWVIGPDGKDVLEQEVPQYERREIRVDVPAGADGKLWSLRTKLAEDLGITLDPALPTIVSEWPETLAQVEKLGQQAGFVKFDGQLTPESQMLAPAPHPQSFRTSAGGLDLSFTADGSLWTMSANGAQISPQSRMPVTGFLVRDMATGELTVVRGELQQEGQELRLTSRLAGRVGLSIEARLKATPEALRGTARVTDVTGKDRTITLYFAIPVAKDDLTWWDDIDTSRPSTAAGELGKFNSTPFGAIGKNSVYPWACVGSPRAAVACAIPLDQPRLSRLAYNPQVQLLYLAWDLALVPETAKFPSAAEVSFAVYAADPPWGFRSAAERYYRLFPTSFEKRLPDGLWVCWSTLAKIPNVEGWGTIYHWGVADPAAAKFDNEHRVLAFLYNDSVRYFADLGTFGRKPSQEQATAVFEQYLDAPDPAAFVLSRPESATGRQRYVSLQHSMGEQAAAEYLKRAVAAVKVSAARDAEGRMQTGYIIDRKDWGPPNWWTGRLYCDPLPEMPGGYGQFLLDEVIGRTFADFARQGARLDGVGLDNYFVYSQYPDCRREHFQYVSHPLCFLKAGLEPAIVGDFALYEWVKALSERMRQRDGYVVSNSCVMPYPFAASLLDMNGFEWNLERMALIARTLASHKALASLPVKPEHYEEPFIRAHVRFAVLPGGYGGGTQLKAAELYRKYVPVIRQLAQTGWEPVTRARSSSEDVKVERFGSGPRMYFTVTNTAQEAREATVTLDLEALKLSGKALAARELFGQKELALKVEGGQAEARLSLPAEGVQAVVVAEGGSEAGAGTAG